MTHIPSNIVDDSALLPPSGPGTITEPTEIEEPQTVDTTPEVEQITPPTTERPISITTSEEARTATTANLQFLEDERVAEAERQLPGGQVPQSIVDELNKAVEAGTTTQEQANRTLQNIISAGGFQPISPVIEPTPTTLTKEERAAVGIEEPVDTRTPEEIESQAQIDELDKELDTATKEIDTLRLSTRDLNKQLMQGIKDRFEIRRTELKDANKRRLASLTQFGFRSGALRRSLSFGGALSGEERAGIQNLAKLDAQESSLLLQAQIAANEQDFELLAEKINAIEATKKEQVEEAKKLNEASIKRNEELDKRKKTIESDRVVSAALTSGITDLNEMFRIIDEAGLDISAEELSDSFSNLTEQIDEKTGTGNVGQFQQAKLENIIPEDMNYFEFLAKEAVAKKVVAGSGPRSVNDLTAFERLAAANLSIDIFGKRAGTKPENRGLVESLMAGGMSVDNIQDELRFTFQSDKFTGSIRTAAENISITLDSTRAEVFTNALDRHIENEDFDLAKETLIRGVEASLDSTQAKTFRGNRRAVELLDEIASDLKEYELLGGNTGVFSGNLEKLSNRIGLIRDPALAEIGNKIAIAIQRYRHDVSGAAFTESEAVEYRSVFPGINKIATLNTALINSAREVLRGDVDSVLRHAMGSNAYNEIFDGESESSPTQGLAKDGDSIQSEVDEDIDAYLNSLNY